MLRNLLAISTNTFGQAVRQPVFTVVIAVTIMLLIASPSLSMFSLDDDNQLLKDIGLSTILVAGLLLAVFAASTVLTEEIENKTVLTVISKTVGRTSFILGKFLGIAAAVLMAQYLLILVFFMVTRHGVMQTARDEFDLVVIILGGLAALITLTVGILGNYLYQWRFTSTAIYLATLTCSIVMAILVFIDPKWNYNPAENHIPADLIPPVLLLMLASLVLTSIAVALATRLNLVMTLILCSIFFILGVMAEYSIAPITQQDGLAKYPAWAALAILPNINLFLTTNAIYENKPIPYIYISSGAAYALLYVSAILLFAVALFRNRELG